jgi:hypothetical protein
MYIQVMYQLPNDLLAFITSDDDGNRTGEVPRNILLDVDIQRDLRNISGASDCFGCHADGALPAVDETRSAWQQYLSGLSADDPERPTALESAATAYARHPPPSTFQALTRSQNDHYADLLRQLGIALNEPEPIGATGRDHQHGMVGMARAAAYFGVSPERLRTELPRMDPRLREMEADPVDANTFRNAYHDSLCLLHAGRAVRPRDCP